MNPVYAVESWAVLQPDLAPLIRQHWEEVALNKDKVPLDPAWDRYEELAKSGVLHSVSVRVDSALVGYHLAMITPHLHYKSTLHGITDIYWLLPEYRKGYTGLDLFRFVEASLRERGVQVLVTATKLHLDMGTLFKRMRYEPTETLFKKVL